MESKERLVLVTSVPRYGSYYLDLARPTGLLQDKSKRVSKSPKGAGKFGIDKQDF
jgi:hypothetical protein